jgi:ribonucleoside-triphosphate reductase
MEDTQTLQLKRTKCEVYSRVVGWIVPVQQWNEGKKSEFVDRQTYDKQIGGGGCGCG